MGAVQLWGQLAVWLVMAAQRCANPSGQGRTEVAGLVPAVVTVVVPQQVPPCLDMVEVMVDCTICPGQVAYYAGGEQGEPHSLRVRAVLYFPLL